MSADGRDVESYLDARWSDLVRTLVLSGCTPEDAEPLTIAACARIQPAWRGARKREEDVDVLLYSALLEERRRHWAGQHPDAAAVGDRRLAAALAQGAGLDEWQVEQVLRVVPGSVDANPYAGLGTEWHEVYRGATPLDGIRAAVRRTRRRRLTAGAALLAAAVVATAVVLVVRPDAAPMPKPPGPTPPRNPIALAWASNDVLHLDRVEVDTPGLTTLAQVGAAPYGAVYGDDEGRVVQVDAAGILSVIGRTRVGDPIVGSSDGTAAWVDPGTAAGDSEIVAWDTTAATEVGRVTINRGSELVAIDGGTVYATGRGTTTTWRVGDSAVDQAAPGLADVAAGLELRSGEVDPFRVPRGQPARVSPDGSLALTWIPGEPSVTLVAPAGSSSSPPALGLEPRAIVLDARFTPDGDVVLVTSRVYLLSMGQDDVTGSSGRSPYADLVTCSVTDGRCTTDLGRNTFAGDSSNPTPIILAR